MQPYLAEFVGTMILVLLGNGVCANVNLKKTCGNDSGWIVITAGWAMAVTMAVYLVNAFSGAHLNPAVTIGLATIGKFQWSQVGGYVAAQMAGGIAGATLVWPILFTGRKLRIQTRFVVASVILLQFPTLLRI